MMGEPLTVLLVEDNEGHAKLIMKSLENHQVANKIVHVTDGEEALDYLYKRGKYTNGKSKRPNLILLDLRLPKVDGFEVLRLIKNDKMLYKIPVVILTTSETDADIEKAYQLNANSYLVKPVDFQKFTQMMKDLGFYWLAWNRHPEIDG